MKVNQFLASVQYTGKRIFLFFANEHPIGPLYPRDRVPEKHNHEINDLYERNDIVYINSNTQIAN